MGATLSHSRGEIRALPIHCRRLPAPARQLHRGTRGERRMRDLRTLLHRGPGDWVASPPAGRRHIQRIWGSTPNRSAALPTPNASAGTRPAAAGSSNVAEPVARIPKQLNASTVR